MLGDGAACTHTVHTHMLPTLVPPAFEQHLRQHNISSVARGYVFVQVLPACPETGDRAGGADTVEHSVGFASQVVAWEGASSCWAPMNDDSVLAFSRALSALCTAD